MAWTYCLEPGCNVLVHRGRCSTHRRSLDQARGSRQQRGYDNRWARRAQLFRAKYPLCGDRPGGLPPVMSKCHDEGRKTLGYQVDHVVPHHGDQRLFWDELNNWQTLCSSCHTRKSMAGF